MTKYSGEEKLNEGACKIMGVWFYNMGLALIITITQGHIFSVFLHFPFKTIKLPLWPLASSVCNIMILRSCSQRTKPSTILTTVLYSDQFLLGTAVERVSKKTTNYPAQPQSAC